MVQHYASVDQLVTHYYCILPVAFVIPYVCELDMFSNTLCHEHEHISNIGFYPYIFSWYSETSPFRSRERHYTWHDKWFDYPSHFRAQIMHLQWRRRRSISLQDC